MRAQAKAIKAGEVHFFEDHDAVINDPARIENMRHQISRGDVYIARGVAEPSELNRIREYLIGIAKGSLPNYHATLPGCPNFHRLNKHDSRAYVDGCFHQFVFFRGTRTCSILFNQFS